MAKSLDVFNFNDYRDYLASWLEDARSRRVSNLSRLASAIGVHTSFLAHVLSGAKNLSFEQAAEVSEVLQHSAHEREYFFALLQIERAGSVKLRKYWQEKRAAVKKEREAVRSRLGDHHELTAEERAIFYSSWIYVAVWVATDIAGGQSLEQIAERFRLPRDKALEVLEFLLRTGVCVRQGSLYKMGTSIVYVPNDHALVVKHHSNWRLRALQKMDTRKATELFLTSPMSMSRSDFARVREIFARAVEESLAICRESKSDDVYCLNIDLFEALRDG